MDTSPRDDNKKPTILSLEELKIHLSAEVRQHLEDQYNKAFNNNNNNDDDDDANGERSAGKAHLEQILRYMKLAPSMTICRVNLIKSTTKQIIENLQNCLQDTSIIQVYEHPIFSDVVCVKPSISPQLTNQRVPKQKSSQILENSSSSSLLLFNNWPDRVQKGWPMAHRVVICDRFCGEAVLRGSDIFVPGILCADSGIKINEQIAVYADIPFPKFNHNDNTNSSNSTMNQQQQQQSISRGLLVKNYTGQCVFVGIGTACCNRNEMFSTNKGIGIKMSPHAQDRVGPCLPPLHGVLQTEMMLQNLPSIIVGHALNPKPNDVILDMCCAPGGKTSHLASLIGNQGIIVACDKSRKKMIAAKTMFGSFGATCIVPLALDSTKCVEYSDTNNWKSPKEIIDDSTIYSKKTTTTTTSSELLQIKKFYPESFDKILLDPPCSALGLRPKLFVIQDTLQDLMSHAGYQKKFIKEAISLLKPGGVMTYSTCTIHVYENEYMIRHVLDEYPCMKLVPIFDIPNNNNNNNNHLAIGQPGLPGVGLTDEERLLVRRFEPNDSADTMGFFVAKFHKESSSLNATS